ARVRDDRSEAAAGAAGARRHHVAEQAAHGALDEAAAVADVAGGRFGTRRTARPLTGLAENGGIDLDLLLRTEHHLGQVNLNPDQGILAAFAAGARWRVSATATPSAEEGLEDVAET